MKELTIFKNERFGEVRTFMDGKGMPWFSAPDVCRALEIKNSSSSLALLDDDEKGVHTMETLGGPQEMGFVNEPGVYSLIFRSRKPEAKALKRWLAHEVLPTIRRTGGYRAQNDFNPLKAMAKRLLELSRKKYEYPEPMRLRFVAEAMSIKTGRPVKDFLPKMNRLSETQAKSLESIAHLGWLSIRALAAHIGVQRGLMAKWLEIAVYEDEGQGEGWTYIQPNGEGVLYNPAEVARRLGPKACQDWAEKYEGSGLRILSEWEEDVGTSGYKRLEPAK
jgi:prophage antirepressor-like protein